MMMSGNDWFTHPLTVTCPSTNRAQWQLTTLIKTNALTATLAVCADSDI